MFLLLDKSCEHEIDWAKALTLPAGSCIVFDRGYTDYTWYGDLAKRKITFVTRLKSNSGAYAFGNRRKPDSPAVLLDQKTKLPGHQATFRRIHYVDPANGTGVPFPHQLDQIESLRGRSHL